MANIILLTLLRKKNR